ncbi:membrane protein [Pandoraea pneumonica]|jgi:GBP family porin|uniref:Membrane protein n=1 Tax=Pandoraea pneumonica TaxID=2508299 RepID=A0A5E4WGX1_9BURK|nr:porin [Pandoraea pneumonica]VVE22305.1 membrane protein [Pandoraea pneumonica]
MKKTLLAAAVVGAFSATAAHAQSSVTLYGLIDAGVAYTSNSTTTAGASGSKNFRATSGLVNGSRWGLKGSEDLGGGNKAIFVLENGFSINNGQSGQNSRMFGRQAFVGLSNDKFGSVTVGRQYDSLVDYLAPLTLNGSSYGGTIASHPYDNDNTNNSFRVNNSVKYSSANYNGLTFGGLYGFSNKAGDFANNRAFSAGVNYANGPLTVAAAYLERQGNPGANNTAGAVDTSAGGDSVFNASKQRVWGIGGNYAFGPATVGLVYTHTQLQGLSGLNYNSTAVSFNNDGLKFDNFEINGRYMLTPAVSLSAAYTYTMAKQDSTDQKPKFHTVTLQADYRLSKRTDVYLTGSYQHISDNQGTGLQAGVGAAGGMSSTSSQTVVGTGIRHRF